MLNEYERERIWQVFYLEKRDIYQVSKEEGFCHQVIKMALFDPLHCLPSLENRQSAFDYVESLKPWWEGMLPCYSPILNPYNPRSTRTLVSHIATNNG